MRAVLTAAGERVTLGRELGCGGEGAVYEVPARDCVAKLYHRAPDAGKQAKLRFMAACRQCRALARCAWPQTTLHRQPGGPPIGFLMPAAAGHESIHRVYSPADRRELWPQADWRFLLQVARETAVAFAALHAQGHVLGDVNQGNVLVSPAGRVVLIDCDSFQIDAAGRLHLCEVGVGHFTPPELLGLTSFAGVVRSPNHDNFGLALLIFHLLLGGRHPYSGVPLLPAAGAALEHDIRAFRYAYATDAARRGLTPPPRALPIGLLPVLMQRMFEAAFTEAGAAGGRPGGMQWAWMLDGLQQTLQGCAEVPAHCYPQHLARCPWCALEQQGVVHFVDCDTRRSQARLRAQLDRLWTQIDAVPTPPDLAAPRLPQGLAPRPLPRGVPGPQRRAAYFTLAGLLAAALLLLAPQAWFFGLLAGAQAALLARSFADEPRRLERLRRASRLAAAQREYRQLLNAAGGPAGAGSFAQKKAQLAALRAASLREEERNGRAARQAVRSALLLARLRRGPQELWRLRGHAERTAAQRRAELAAAGRRLAQAQADLTIL